MDVKPFGGCLKRRVSYIRVANRYVATTEPTKELVPRSEKPKQNTTMTIMSPILGG